MISPEQFLRWELLYSSLCYGGPLYIYGAQHHPSPCERVAQYKWVGLIHTITRPLAPLVARLLRRAPAGHAECVYNRVVTQSRRYQIRLRFAGMSRL
jgi:hypothetical protein